MIQGSHRRRNATQKAQRECRRRSDFLSEKSGDLFGEKKGPLAEL